ncbi:g9892 [Coccomyxa elongata]
MTFLIDLAGMQGAGLLCYGGEEERWAKLQGKEPSSCVHKPAVKNVAPRPNSWRSSRSNTQTPSLNGPDKDMQPQQRQARQTGLGRPDGRRLP